MKGVFSGQPSKDFVASFAIPVHGLCQWDLAYPWHAVVQGVVVAPALFASRADGGSGPVIILINSWRGACTGRRPQQGLIFQRSLNWSRINNGGRVKGEQFLVPACSEGELDFPILLYNLLDALYVYWPSCPEIIQVGD